VCNVCICDLCEWCVCASVCVLCVCSGIAFLNVRKWRGRSPPMPSPFSASVMNYVRHRAIWYATACVCVCSVCVHGYICVCVWVCMRVCVLVGCLRVCVCACRLNAS